MGWMRVADTSEIAPGERGVYEVDGTFVALFNVGGEFFAIADICTHDGGPLAEGELRDQAIVCPRHGARFDVRTGEVISFPATEPVPAYPVRIRGGKVEVELL